MNAIIILLNAIFAKLTTAVNKVFTKSQRPFMVLDTTNSYLGGFLQFFSGGQTELTLPQLFSEYVASINPQVPDGLQALTFPNGDGEYRVKYIGETLPTEIGTVSDGVFLNITVVGGIPVSGSIEGFSVNELAEIAATADTAKSQAISAAAADATTKANNAKIQAIEAAALDATAKADEALTNAQEYANTAATNAANDAIVTAASDATTKANTALTSAQQYTSANIAVALQTAHDDAFTLALTAEQNAVAVAEQEAANAVVTAKTYTDAEIAKLQLYAQKGIKNLGRFVHQLTGGSLGTLPSATAFGFSEVGFYVVEVEATDANGAAIFGESGTLEVATGVDANGAAILTTISVSTEDEIMVEVVLIDGLPFLKYVKKHDVRVLEMFNQLSTIIETHVSESELLSAVTDVKTYVDAQINAALV